MKMSSTNLHKQFRLATFFLSSPSKNIDIVSPPVTQQKCLLLVAAVQPPQPLHLCIKTWTHNEGGSSYSYSSKVMEWRLSEAEQPSAMITWNAVRERTRSERNGWWEPGGRPMFNVCECGPELLGGCAEVERAAKSERTKEGAHSGRWGECL